MRNPLASRTGSLQPLVLALSVALGAPAAAASSDAPTPAAYLQAEGYIEPELLPTTCQQGFYVITNLCTGAQFLLESSSLDLGSILCMDVIVSGPDVGVECPIIDVQAALAATPACRMEVRSLSVMDPVSTWLEWSTLPCSAGFDVIRGTIPGPTVGATAVDLGPVFCLANDVPYYTNYPTDSTYSGPRDTETPPEGQAFFYLVRATGASFGTTPYGYSSAGLVLLPASGDCPL